MADMGQIPPEPWEIQPMEPFGISSSWLFFTDFDIPVMTAELPVVTDDEVDCDASIDYDSAIPPGEEVNRPDVHFAPGRNLEVGAPYPSPRSQQWVNDFPIDTNGDGMVELASLGRDIDWDQRNDTIIGTPCRPSGLMAE